MSVSLREREQQYLGKLHGSVCHYSAPVHVSVPQCVLAIEHFIGR